MPRTHDGGPGPLRPASAAAHPRADVAHLTRLVRDLHVTDRAALGRAVDAAHEAAAPPDPDRFEVGGAVERVLKLARGAADFCARAEAIAAAVAPLAAWIGPQAGRLEGLVRTRSPVHGMGI
jgi:hypothetical protein